jgi:cytoskeleton protein RodZ
MPTQQSAQPHPAPPAAKPQAAPAPVPAPKAAAQPEPAPAAPAAKVSQLELQFSESSFIRVEDARGKTLAIGLVRGGEYQKLEGDPPYTVFIGNAKNVKVFYGNRPVDFSAHVNGQNDTARFTVP